MLREFEVTNVYHYAPLHYLAFIARSGVLLSKTKLRARGFATAHFRSTSSSQDIQRGFAHFVHLTLDSHPPILKAKLAKGFPHFEVAVPAQAFEGQEFSLCRFNIAKTRYFRGAKQEPEESEANGRYQSGLLLPIATSIQERRALMRHNFGKRMIEVLVRDQLTLPQGTTLRFFHADDAALGQTTLRRLNLDLTISEDRVLTYRPNERYRRLVIDALERSIADERWFGNGLEFDRV